MTEGELRDPFAEGRDAYNRFGKMLDQQFDLVKEESGIVEKGKTLSDGTVITVSKDSHDGGIEVICKEKDVERSSADFELCEEGLWGIRIKRVLTKLGEGGCTMEYRNIELGYGRSEEDSKWLQAFRNSAPVVVDWVGEILEKDEFVYPVSMLSLVQLK